MLNVRLTRIRVYSTRLKANHRRLTAFSVPQSSSSQHQPQSDAMAQKAGVDLFSTDPSMQERMAELEQRRIDAARRKVEQEMQARKAELEQQQRDIDAAREAGSAKTAAQKQALEMERLKLAAEKLEIQRQRDEAHAKPCLPACLWHDMR